MVLCAPNLGLFTDIGRHQTACEARLGWLKAGGGSSAAGERATGVSV